MIKRILHITPTDSRFDSRILKELNALKDISNSKIIAFGIDDNEGHNYIPNEGLSIRTFKLFTKNLKIIPRPVRYFLNLLEAFFRLTISGIKFRPSIIHCHDTLFLPIAILIKWLCKSQLIYDAHELESDKAGQSKILSKYSLFIERISWKKINFLVSVSPSIINWYQEHLGKKKSELVLNAPMLNNGNRSEEKSDYLRQKFEIPAGKKIFLYLGIINKKGRGVDLYLEIFRKNDIQSHIVFVGYGEYANEIKKNAAIYPNIHYHESVPHDMVVQVSKSADFGLCMVESVSLSDYYSLPNKLFEYAFAGLFVIASDFPDIRHYVEEYSLGTCSSLNVEALHKTISAMENSEMKAFDGRHERLYPISWECQAEKLVALYNELLLN